MAQICDYTKPNSSIRCTRPATAGARCVLHSEDRNKDPNEIRRIYNQLHERGTPIDLTGTIFFTYPEKLLDVSFRVKIILDHCLFACPVTFNGSRFETGISMKNATFREHLIFTSNCSLHNADFSGSVFEMGVSFGDALVKSALNLEGTTFGPGGSVTFKRTNISEGRLILRQTKFLCDTSFEDIAMTTERNQLDFRSCDMSGVNITSWPAFPKYIDFDDVAWPNKTSWLGLSRRTVIRDEINSARGVHVLRAYRFLHKYYLDASHFDLASEFYIGLMTLKRKSESIRRLAMPFNWLYSTLSRYGESIGRPLSALAAMWTAVPLLFLHFGVIVRGKEVIPRYVFGFGGQSEFLLFNADYWKTVLWNMSLSSIYRGANLSPDITDWRHLVIFIETIFNLLFFGFLALGIRRQFRPVPEIK